MPKKKKAPKAGNSKRRSVEIPLTFRSLLLWGTVLFLLMGWSFFLGVIAGRGLLPERMMSAEGLKSLVKGISPVPGRQKGGGTETMPEPAKDPKLAFYEKLSSKKEEVVRKRIRRPSPRARPKPPPLEQGPLTSAVYTVQVASLESEVRAMQMVNRLTARGYEAFYSRALLNGKTRYRVRCGRLPSAGKARSLAAVLEKKERLKGFVTRQDAP